MSEEKAPTKTDAAVVVLYLGIALCGFAIVAIVINYQFMGYFGELETLASYVDDGQFGEGMHGYWAIPLLTEASCAGTWLFAARSICYLKDIYDKGKLTVGAVVLILVAILFGALLVIYLFLTAWAHILASPKGGVTGLFLFLMVVPSLGCMFFERVQWRFMDYLK